MKTRNPILLTLLVSAVMVLFAFVSEARLPAGTELPIRWGMDGNPVRYAPSLFALLIAPVILLMVGAIFAIVPSIEPLQDRLEGSAPLLRAAWIGIMPLMVLVQFSIAGPAWGFEPSINLVLLACGALLVILGNAMPKSRPGFFVGIRTPWTITNEDNWIATHRLGGRLAIIAGAITILASLVMNNMQTIAVIMVAATLTATLVPVVYSWWFWRNSKAQGMGGE